MKGVDCLSTVSVVVVEVGDGGDVQVMRDEDSHVMGVETLEKKHEPLRGSDVPAMVTEVPPDVDPMDGVMEVMFGGGTCRKVAEEAEKVTPVLKDTLTV